MSLDFVDVDTSDRFPVVDCMERPGAPDACDATLPLPLACDRKVVDRLISLFSLTEGFGFARLRGLMMVHHRNCE